MRFLTLFEVLFVFCAAAIIPLDGSKGFLEDESFNDVLRQGDCGMIQSINLQRLMEAVESNDIEELDVPLLRIVLSIDLNIVQRCLRTIYVEFPDSYVSAVEES